jgi:hypothetical protein
MSITVIKDLKTVMPIGNEMLLQLQTDNRYSTAGSKATLTFTFTGIDTTVGHGFALAWGVEVISFVLAAAPDDSGEQITVATGGQSVDAWMAIFAADLMQNYYLRRDFDCAVDTVLDKITLTAKENGVDYNLTISSASLTNVALAAVACVDPVVRENYELLCLADILEGATWEFLNEDRIPPDATGLVEFDLHDLFGPELAAEHTWPEIAETYYAKRANHIKQYQLFYAELYENSVNKLTAYANSVYAILGSFDYKMMAALNGVAYSFMDFIVTYKSFLTWQPTSKTINTTQPEKLFYLVFNDITTLELHIKVYYDDNTDSGDCLLETVTPVARYEVYEFMVGYSQINFSDLDPGYNPGDKTVIKYDIWLEDDADNVQSQTRTFTLETKTFRNERIYLFRNSFGAMDTLRATGRKTQLNEYDRLLLERNHVGFSLQEQYQVLERSVFTINSGWLTFSQRNWLRELLLSREAYEIIGGYKFPIIISDDKREFRDDDAYLYSLEINYKYAFKDPAFSGDYLSTPLLAENLNILLNENGEPLYA